MQPKSASRQQGEDIGMEVQAYAPVPRLLLMGGREGGKEAAGCCQAPPAKDTAAFLMATRTLTSLSLFSPVSAAFPGNLDGQGDPLLSSQAITGERCRDRQLMPVSGWWSSLAITGERYRGRQPTQRLFPALTPASSSLLPLIPDALLGWPRKSTGLA